MVWGESMKVTIGRGVEIWMDQWDGEGGRTSAIEGYRNWEDVESLERREYGVEKG